MEKQNTSVIQKLSISYECALAIGNSLNLSEMLHDVIHTIVHKTNAHRGSIWLREEKEGENIKLGARAGSLLTKAEIKKRVSAFQDIFEKIWKNQRPVIKNRDDKDFFQYCFKITGKEQSILIVPVKNVAILKLVYTNKEIVNETLANMLLSLSEKLSIAINACLAHDNIKKEIQIRKDTEDLLKHSEQQYRSTIDSISKAIHVVDENLSILLFNKTLKQWNKEFGLDTENLIDRNIFDIFTFLPDAVRDEYQKVFKTGKTLITIETNELAGKKITTETRKIPILENNKVARVVTVIDDITERKQAEEALKKEKATLNNIINLNPYSIQICDKDGYHIRANQAFMDLFNTIPPREWSILNDPILKKAGHLGLIHKVKSGEIVQVPETWYNPHDISPELPDKRKCISSVNFPILNQDGEVENIVIMHENLTERKQVEEKLRLFFQSVESSVDGIAMGEQGRITYVNEAFATMLGYSKDELIGKEVAFIYAEDQRPKLEEAVKATMEGNWTGELVGKRKNDELFPLAISTSRVVDDKGKVIAIMASHRDITERKQAEEALRESEKRYRTLIEKMEEGIGIVDENENFTFVNQAAANMFGYPKKELLGKNLKELTTPEEFQRVIEQTSIRQTGKSSKYELSIFRKDGEQRLLSVTATPKFDDNGKYQGTFGIFHDITTSKHAVAKLEQSEEKYHTLIDNIQDGVFIIQGVEMQFVNEAFAKMVGYTVEETIGMDFRQLIAPEDIEIVADRYRRRQAGEDVPGEYEFRMLYKDGVTRVIVHMNVGLVNYQGKLASMGTVKDITKRKQAEDELKNKSEQIISDKEKIEELYKESEESRKSLLSILEDVSEKEKALRESEERFKNIVANTGDWIWETDTDGRYTYCSPIIKQVLGYEYQEMLGKHFYDLALPEEQDKFKKTAFERSKKKEKVKNLVIQNVHKDGHIVFLETNAVPLLDDKGNLLGYRGVTRDITERKRAEQTQSVLYNIADAVNTTKDLDELFHSIQSYLTTILDTTNFFIALYDKETDTISLPYHVDKKDKFTSFPAGKTFTGYVIKKGKPLLATEQVMKKLIQTGEVEKIGTFSKIWLGVPLKIENEVTGVVAVQSYTDASLYTEKDLAILEFVSDSIAIAIAHMRADNALENSEEKYRLLFEETPIGILTCDINGIIQSINNTALQLLGSPSEEATKQINLLTFPPLKEIGFSDDLKYCMNEGREIISEKLYTSKWRKSVFFHYKIIPTLNQEGKITGALCALEDITEQKRAEEIQSTIYKISDAINTTANLDELYQIIHQHLSTVIDTTNFYIALYDEEKEFISFPYFVDEKDSQPAPRKLRKGLTEYVMRTSKAIFVTKESLYKLEEKDEVELLGSSSALWLGIPLKIEEKIIGVMAVQSYTDPSLYNKKDLAILEFASDQIAIAIEIKQAEDAQRKSEEKFRDLFENANDVIWTSDIRGRYLSVNHLFEKLLGYTKKELINKQSLHLVAQEDKKKSTKNYQKAVSGKPVEFEITILTKENERKIFWIKLRPVEENGKVTSIHGIGRDLTERKEAEEALFQAEVQLRQAQKMEAVGRLAGGMAHDFNNLLTAITGYSDLLLNKLGEIDPLSKYPKEIRKAAEQASSLTSQLLTFSRKQVLELKVLDINALVTDMQEMLHRLIGEDIELANILEPKLGRVKADKGQINQVIMNMVVNARDAMPNGGKINLETANVELDKEYARQHAEVEAGSYVMLAVTDTGCGMDEETQSRIFEPFFTTKELDKGTGLGLSTVYGIVKQSDGSIWVYSELGQGTTFKIYLPRVDEGVELPKPTIAEPELLKGSETILLVEDKEMVRDLILEILEKNGYNVLTASLGREAISICKQHKDTIHLMLTDVVMPQMSGCELAKQLKNLRPDMKVLFMSGYTGKEVIERGILEPGTAFIQKPMSPDDLAHKVREVLEAPKQKKG